MKSLYTLILLVVFVSIGHSQEHPNSDVFVDENGIMRWASTKEEVKGFGVNYSVPFAHAYRSAQRLHIDVKKAIDQDVYHFTRLGFDLYRLHVWDTEISDVHGNLIENDHLDAFDYLLNKLKEHQINYVITPIAFWGNGWPEPDTESPGFSHKYGKADCLTNPDAIAAQQNYLYQFLNHVNPYTGVAYKDEPNVIAFEVSNEPHHRGNAQDVTTFVKGMVDAMRRTGTSKPIFYNMSHAVHNIDAYFQGGVQGGTFQWYPTGLGYGKELSGNLLPNVDNYHMPFDDVFKKHQGAKLVYEFDAADVGRSYIYPAMARSFRTAGIQIATHFAYDPSYLGPFNTEYNTHYMNLNYTPQKALSLKICAEVFHEIPLHANYGRYPQNTTFGNFKVDYKNDLSEYNSKAKFFYTNHTKSQPIDEASLTEIAGFGSSPLVEYEGVGAYFLDKIARGVWRLEVLPDAVWVDNPFGRNSLNKTVGVTKWQIHKMGIKLKDLGTDFSMTAINQGNTFQTDVVNGSFNIKPGTYVLSRKNVEKSWTEDDAFKTNKLNDFYAPPSHVKKTWLKHQPQETIAQGDTLQIKVQCISEFKPKEISLVGYNSNGTYFNQTFESSSPYQYTATIPSETIKTGYINYNIIVTEENGKQITFPSGKPGHVYDWDFYDRVSYKVPVLPKAYPIYLFNAHEDANDLVRQWRQGFKLIPTEYAGISEYQIKLDTIFKIDEENRNATPIYDYSFKHFVIDKLRGRTSVLPLKEKLIFNGRSLNEQPCQLQVALVLDDGSSYGAIINVDTEMKDYVINISDLQPVKTVTLPRPYPSFLPYYFDHNNSTGFDITRVESIQFSIGPGISEAELQHPHGIGIVSVRLE